MVSSGITDYWEIYYTIMIRNLSLENIHLLLIINFKHYTINSLNAIPLAGQKSIIFGQNIYQ